MTNRGKATPSIRAMQTKFAMVHLYGDKSANKWGISEFCQHFECTEEEVKAQFHRLWENERDFSARWKQLAKNSKKKGGKEMADAKKSDNTKVEETNVVVAEERVEEEQAAPSSTPSCVRTPESYDQKIERSKSRCRKLYEQIKLLLDELLDEVNMGIEYEKEKSRLESTIVFHVHKSGYVNLPFVGARQIIGGWDREAVDEIMCNDIGEWLDGFDYAGADRSHITSAKKAVARCSFVEDRCKKNGRCAEFEFEDDLSKRAYQYARAIRARLVANASETAS